MAYDGATNKAAFVAGTTFSTGDLYKGVVINSSGHVVVPATTDVSGLVIGTLYSNTATTGGAGVEAVTVGLGPIIKVNMAASTLAAGGSVGFSTDGLGIAPTTDATIWGVIAQGSSGSAGRIATVVRTNG
jgi:hypothetical protein